MNKLKKLTIPSASTITALSFNNAFCNNIQLFCQDRFPYIIKTEAFDTETTSLDPYTGGKIFSYSRFDGKNPPIISRLDRGNQEERRVILQRYLDDYTIAKVCHNLKFEISMLLMNGFKIHPLTVWHDTMIMSQMLDNLKLLHGLDDLAWELCGYPKDNDKKVAAIYKDVGNYQLIPEPLMYDYQMDDAFRGMLLFEIFAPVILSTGMLDSYLYEIEVIKVVQQMEEYGLMLNIKGAYELISWLDEEIDALQKETRQIFGRFVNPNSDVQVKWAFYDQFNFPMLAFTESSMGSYKYAVKALLKNGVTGKELKAKYPQLQPKVDKHVIFALQEAGYEHPFLDLVIKYRTYTTGKSTIRNSYIGKADKNYIVRSNIKSNHDKSGRMAAEKPNVQNVAKEGVLLNPFPIPARKCWRARPGHFLDFMDYGQIELRLVIAICQDPILFAALQNDEDTHNILASLWYHDVAINNEAILGPEHVHLLGKLIRFAELDKKDSLRGKLRKASKNANFGLPFGAQKEKLVKTLGLNDKFVQEGLDRIHERHPSYFNFAKTQEKNVKKYGYVVTPFGRILYVDYDRPYSGANYIIQGTAAEILKRAMVHIHKYYLYKWGDLIQEYQTDLVPCVSINALQLRMPRLVVPIHDELMQEKHRIFLQYDNTIIPEVAAIAVDFPQIPVPLKVEYKRSFTTWDNAKEIDFSGKFKE